MWGFGSNRAPASGQQSSGFRPRPATALASQGSGAAALPARPATAAGEVADVEPVTAAPASQTPPPADRATVLKEAREAARAEHCIVCHDDKPSVLSLCCGAAFHAACLAKWAAEHPTCPQCRTQLKADHGIALRQQHDRDAGRLLTMHDAMTAELETRIFSMRHMRDAAQDARRTAEARADSLATELRNVRAELQQLRTAQTSQPPQQRRGRSVSRAPPQRFGGRSASRPRRGQSTRRSPSRPRQEQQQQHPCLMGDCNRIAAMNCANGFCLACCEQWGQQTCERHGHTGASRPNFCRRCDSRQFARNCDNQLCASCCTRPGYGWHVVPCVRHGTAEESESDGMDIADILPPPTASRRGQARRGYTSAVW